ncbi:MAG: hypothetical protein J7L08_03855 [Candidatus Aenigmarchaeota archaeon]|nr:hypothetical protein [Candidatus Aenigmarchaeota archaeon]
MSDIQITGSGLNGNLTFRSMQDLVKIKKPVVKRKGQVVYYCSFFKRTGQCFGTRCFWTNNGTCPFFDKENLK